MVHCIFLGIRPFIIARFSYHENREFTNGGKMMKEKKQLPELIHRSYSDFLKSIDDFFFDAFQHFNQNGMFVPSFPVRTYEKNNEFIIEAELPGVKKSQIQLDIYQNFVRIGVRNEEIVESKDEQNNFLSSSHSYEKRERTVGLPFQVTEKDVKASFTNGLLVVRFPNKRKTIEIE